MAKQIKNKISKREVTLDGLMTVCKSENGARMADFMCCEDVNVESFIGRFKVQGMCDGNMYMQELPKKQRNKPLFRLDHSSFTLGRDGQFYFNFILPEADVEALPELLMKDVKQTIINVKEMCLNKR